MEINQNRIADQDIYNNLSYYQNPKQYYLEMIDVISKRIVKPNNIIDIGCSNGSFLYHFNKYFTDTKIFGLEPVKELAVIAEKELKTKIFNNHFLDFEINQKFEIISIMGVLGIFIKVEDVIKKISNLLQRDGLAIIFSPFNEENIDVILNYRVAPDNDWQSGHNLFSMRTIEYYCKKNQLSVEWRDFILKDKIDKTNDAMRSWTENFRGNKNHLFYGSNMFSTMKFAIIRN